MPESSSSPTSSVKRACDACHGRKVKCIGDGLRPCKNCISAGPTCTYTTIPQKKGPEGSRAKVISELREKQRQSQLATQDQHGIEFGDAPTHSLESLREAGLLSTDMITTCVDYFFANLYPTQPILHRQKVSEMIGQMDTSIEAYCIAVSLCAYMMIQPNMVIPRSAFHDLNVQPHSSLQLGHTLLQEALRVRKSYNYVDNPTIWSVITSFLFFGSYFCLDKQHTAWFHLRDATTLAHIMGMHDESSYNSADFIENSRKRRLYWLLFVTERAYALQQHRPLTLHATINLPSLDEDPTETVELRGFVHLVSLFRPFDDTFVGLWNKARTGCTTDCLARLQQQLSDALPAYLHSTESQAVDLRCSQQWLRTMVWQLSISHGFLSSGAADNAMSFKFPIEIARDLVAAASGFSQQAMEIHGIGLIEKLFDVACTLTDVMSVIPIEQNTFGFGPRDYLNQMMTLISTLRGYLPLLLSKINETVPQMPNPGYTIRMVPRSSPIGEFFDAQSQSTQSHSSRPNSGKSTPLGSPPLSAVAHSFQQQMSLCRSSASNSFLVMTTGVAYGGLTATAPIEGIFQDPIMHGYPSISAPMKYDNDG